MNAGSRTACTILSNSSVACWGWGASGELGVGSNPPSYSDLSIACLISQEISGDKDFSWHTNACVILTNGSISCWGKNQYGQLVVKDLATSPKSPVLTQNLGIWNDTKPSYCSVSAGGEHTCAV